MKNKPSFRTLSLTVTNDCNFSCEYCYKKGATKDKQSMNFKLAKNSINFFMPYMQDEFIINFYGGEPLLEFDLMKGVVEYTKALAKKTNKFAKFSITTNGSLLNDAIIDFLDENWFFVELSYDGIDQGSQRGTGSEEKLIEDIEKIVAKPHIKLETNSVFTHISVRNLSLSIRNILDLGVESARISVSYNKPWPEHNIEAYRKELDAVVKYALDHHKKTGNIPIANFKENPEERLSYCSAGQDRIAVDQWGCIWGCPLFSDYFGRLSGDAEENIEKYSPYFFGWLANFVSKERMSYVHFEETYNKKIENYKKLITENYKTPARDCLLCIKLYRCKICPISAAFQSGEIGKVPAHMCQLKQVMIEAIEKFWERYEK